MHPRNLEKRGGEDPGNIGRLRDARRVFPTFFQEPRLVRISIGQTKWNFKN